MCSGMARGMRERAAHHNHHESAVCMQISIYCSTLNGPFVVERHHRHRCEMPSATTAAIAVCYRCYFFYLHLLRLLRHHHLTVARWSQTNAHKRARQPRAQQAITQRMGYVLYIYRRQKTL